jgi:thiamine kinase-like enzyme
MQNAHPYVEINGKFFSLKQNPIRLAWYLICKTKSLNARRSFSRKRKFNYFKIFFLTYYGLIKKKSVSFPFFGHLILKVHGGYRVFDFSREIVIKVIEAKSNPPEGKNEVEGIKIAGQFDFVPNIIHCNADRNWYEEELVRGDIGFARLHGDSKILLNMFKQEVSPCLLKMILIRPPSKITVGAIVNQCNQIWQHSRPILQELDTYKVDLIKEFISSITLKLSPSVEQSVFKILTHGDFSLRNMLHTKKGLKVIDWESIAARSVLFDLYNFFLTELYYDRVSTNLVSETGTAISALQENLNSENSEIGDHIIEFVETYRWLYYIERICMLLDRGLNYKSMEVVCRSIEIFSKFEKEIR